VYEYAVVPPVAVAVAVPVFAPQFVGVAATETLNAAAGCVIVTVVEPGQLLASVTFTVYVPALSAFCVAPDNPPGVHV
jgi:hypothetical protein